MTYAIDKRGPARLRGKARTRRTGAAREHDIIYGLATVRERSPVDAKDGNDALRAAQRSASASRPASG